MSQVNQTLPAVLRRRARTLLGDGIHGPEFVSAILRAADELQVRQAMQLDEEEELAVNLIAQVRLLRALLADIHHAMARKSKPFGWERELLTRIERLMAQATGLGEGRRILAVQVGDEQTLEEIIEKATTQITGYFKERTDANNNEEDTEPSSAGRDTDQSSGTQEAYCAPGGEDGGGDGHAVAAPAAVVQTESEEADAIGHGAESAGARPGNDHASTSSTEAAPLDLTERLSRPCDHKFIDSKTCVKCGWSPDAEV